MCNAYEIISEREDVSKGGYHRSLLGYENVDWFVDEFVKIENKMNFYFKNTKKYIKMT